MIIVNKTLFNMSLNSAYKLYYKNILHNEVAVSMIIVNKRALIDHCEQKSIYES